MNPVYASQDASTLRALRQRYNDAISAHDAGAVGACWMPDIQVLTSAGKPLIGRDAVQQAFQRFFDDRAFITFTRTPRDIEISEDGQNAAERGDWLGRWRGERGERQQRGAYMASWRKIGARWLLQAELFVPLTRLS